MLGKPAQFRPHDDEVQEVPLLQDEVRLRNLGLTEAADGRDEDPAGHVELGHPRARGGIRQLDADPSTPHDDRVHGQNDTRPGGNIYVSLIGAWDFLTKSLRAVPLEPGPRSGKTDR